MWAIGQSPEDSRDDQRSWKQGPLEFEACLVWRQRVFKYVRARGVEVTNSCSFPSQMGQEGMFMSGSKGHPDQALGKLSNGKGNWHWKRLPREAVKFHLLEIFKLLSRVQGSSNPPLRQRDEVDEPLRSLQTFLCLYVNKKRTTWAWEKYPVLIQFTQL